jgi:hypothetical protein
MWAGAEQGYVGSETVEVVEEKPQFVARGEFVKAHKLPPCTSTYAGKIKFQL